MKNAFTMIELIFVIVIIGILSAIAIPKLANTSLEARKSLAVEFISTLNRTAAATMYAEAIRDNNGSVIHASKYCKVLSESGNAYLEPIDEVVVADDCTITLGGALSGESTSDNNFTDGTLKRAPRWRFKW